MSDLPDTSPTETTPNRDDDQGAALERSAETIREAKDASGSVAAHDDITTLDDQRAGEHSDNPDGEGGLP